MKLIKGSDPRLKEMCPEFNFETGVTLDDGTVLNGKELYELLRDKMVEEKGVGLSACQLGIMTRVFVIGNPSEPNDIIGVFNPLIVDYDEETVVYEEGCLSYPGMFIKIKRPRVFASVIVVGTEKLVPPGTKVTRHEYFSTSTTILMESRSNNALIAFT